METLNDLMEGQVNSLVGASITTTVKARPHICSFCQVTFRRDEHLQRHARCHTKEKKYQCPCGVTFARNDVFIRHMRGCRKALSDNASPLVNRSKPRTKTKRACDECAKAKTKCDHLNPCGRCRLKSLKCEKTREGYEDLYSNYSIQSQVLIDIEAENMTQRDNTDNIIFDYGYEAPHLESPVANTTSQALQQQQNGEQNNTAVTCLPSPPNDMFSEACFHITDLFTGYNLPGDEDGIALDQYPTSIYFASIGNLEALFNPHGQSEFSEGPGILPFYQDSHSTIGDGFSLARLDPLEAKCNEIIDLLKRSDPLHSEGISYSYITRHNMLHLCILYGKHFQHNLPIIHSPTFDIAKSPPMLVLAIMLVGACYSEGSISSAQVTELALRLLNLIELQPNETNMQCSSISTIQTGMLICCILSCSPDVTAQQSVGICFARNISMCKRDGLFEPIETVDYIMLNEETFDWDLWIEQELRRRIGCEMFCQDMVHCIFLGRTPRLDPCQFQVYLPSYEACWEAKTASNCLQRLQTLPQQICVSTAIRLLISWPDADAPLFEASGFGMHVLVNGLHYLLHQATRADQEIASYMPAATSTEFTFEIPDSQITTAIERLKEDSSGPSVTAIADRIVKICGSPAIRRIDNALNSWRSTWDLRQNRDIQREDYSFKGDPLPFWWLAKLYLILHYNIVQADSEFAAPRAEGQEGHRKTAVQRKIVGWLSSFRGNRYAMDRTAESWLPDLMKPSREKTS